MATKGIFPQSNVDFNTYVLAVVAYLTTNAMRLGISTSHISDLAALLLLWTPVFTQSEDSTVATATSKHQRDAYRSDFENLLRDIYHDIPDSALTVTDRDKLHLSANDTPHTPAGVPTVAPVVTVDKMSHLQHTLRFQNPETPESSAKPDGVATVEIYGYLSGSNQPVPVPNPNPVPSEDNFHHIAGTGKFLYTVNFTSDDVGKTIYYLARYRNTRGEVGAFSVMINAQVG